MGDFVLRAAALNRTGHNSRIDKVGDSESFLINISKDID